MQKQHWADEAMLQRATTRPQHGHSKQHKQADDLRTGDDEERVVPRRAVAQRLVNLPTKQEEAQTAFTPSVVTNKLLSRAPA
jgi:hypothetical protein